jgi:hypothetical protein
MRYFYRRDRFQRLVKIKMSNRYTLAAFLVSLLLIAPMESRQIKSKIDGHNLSISIFVPVSLQDAIINNFADCAKTSQVDKDKI